MDYNNLINKIEQIVSKNLNNKAFQLEMDSPSIVFFSNIDSKSMYMETRLRTKHRIKGDWQYFSIFAVIFKETGFHLLDNFLHHEITDATYVVGSTLRLKSIEKELQKLYI